MTGSTLRVLSLLALLHGSSSFLPLQQRHHACSGVASPWLATDTRPCTLEPSYIALSPGLEGSAEDSEDGDEHDAEDKALESFLLGIR